MSPKLIFAIRRELLSESWLEYAIQQAWYESVNGTSCLGIKMGVAQ